MARVRSGEEWLIYWWEKGDGRKMFQYNPFAGRGSRITARLERAARQARAPMESD